VRDVCRASRGPWIVIFGVRHILRLTSLGSAPTSNQVVGVLAWGSSNKAVKGMAASHLFPSKFWSNTACKAYSRHKQILRAPEGSHFVINKLSKMCTMFFCAALSTSWTVPTLAQVTTIPGLAPTERPYVNDQSAEPFPLPSAHAPNTGSDTPCERSPENTTGGASPGSSGSGARHPQILRPPNRAE
jgi:hypothetical protein